MEQQQLVEPGQQKRKRTDQKSSFVYEHDIARPRGALKFYRLSALAWAIYLGGIAFFSFLNSAPWGESLHGPLYDKIPSLGEIEGDFILFGLFIAIVLLITSIIIDITENSRLYQWIRRRIQGIRRKKE